MYFVSANSFTNTLPRKLFQLPSIATVLLLGNCFTGTLSPALCQTSLTGLGLDGLTTGRDCQRPLLLNSYTPSHYIVGTIPSCLFTLPLLKVLQLSGIAITLTYVFHSSHYEYQY